MAAMYLDKYQNITQHFYRFQNFIVKIISQQNNNGITTQQNNAGIIFNILLQTANYSKNITISMPVALSLRCGPLK
jgi:hypothetical protein